MDTMYIGPFSADEVDTILRTMKAQLDNLEDFLDHGMEPGVDKAVAFLNEQTKLGRIIDRIESIQLSQ